MAYHSVNPYTGETNAAFDNHTDAEVEQRLAAAHELYLSPWSRPENLAARLASLQRLAEVMEARREEIARIITADMGKRLSESRGETATCIDIVRYYADHAREFLKPVTYPSVLGAAHVEHHPVGIILAVEPWNFPIYQLVRVIAPALAAGNPVAAKHAGNVPQCALLMEDLVREARAPAGAYANLFVTPDQIACIIADDRVQGVALTGSEQAGSIVAGHAGSKLKKATMELGGNDAFIVLDDADVAVAAAAAAGARLYNAGQVCTSAKRYIVHRDIADAFAAHVIEIFAGMRMGDPADDAVTLAPLSSARAKADLQKQLERAIEHGAEVLCGNLPAEGNFFTPTLLAGITRDNPAYYEEFFGPVAQLYVVADDEEAVALANDSHYGLGATVYSGDTERASRMASRLEAGMVFVNRTNDSVAQLPFGGVKRSGFGRELADLGIMEFVNRKLVVTA